jgi:hypothetical protein
MILERQIERVCGDLLIQARERLTVELDERDEIAVQTAVELAALRAFAIGAKASAFEIERAVRREGTLLTVTNHIAVVEVDAWAECYGGSE